MTVISWSYTAAASLGGVGDTIGVEVNLGSPRYTKESEEVDDAMLDLKENANAVKAEDEMNATVNDHDGDDGVLKSGHKKQTFRFYRR